VLGQPNSAPEGPGRGFSSSVAGRYERIDLARFRCHRSSVEPLFREIGKVKLLCLGHCRVYPRMGVHRTEPALRQCISGWEG
jgi:hypothetical protein